MINQIKQDLERCNITWKDILEFCYILAITDIAIILGFICWMEGVFK